MGHDAPRLDARIRRLRAALGFLQLPPAEPELRLLHHWLDTWAGVGLIIVGVERHGMRLSLSHVADGEWRAYFTGDNPKLAPGEETGRRDAVARSAIAAWRHPAALRSNPQ
jgi:hypothetical protein